MNIGDVILRVRSEQGLTRKALAALSGVSQKHIEFSEHGKTNPSDKTVYKLSRALNVDLYKLLEELNKKDNDSVNNNNSNQNFRHEHLSEQEQYKFRQFGIIQIDGPAVKPVEAIMHAPGKPRDTGEYVPCLPSENKPSIHALKVTGDCLANDKIEDGTILFVDVEESPYPGCKVLIYHNGTNHPRVIKYKGPADLENCIYYGIVKARHYVEG